MYICMYNIHVYTPAVLLVALWVATVTVFGIVTAVLCSKIHKLKQKGNLTIMQCMLQYTTFVMYCNFCYIIIILHFLSSSVSHQKNLSVTLPTLGIPYSDPTPYHIHISSDDPSTIQLQPNPSYCLLEMGCQQQPMSSQLENDMSSTCNACH